MSNLSPLQLAKLQGYVAAGNRISYWTKLAEFQEMQRQDNRYALLSLGVTADNDYSKSLSRLY